MQLQIAARGLQLLRTGGLMVYSTCTFNPIEDEAVVAALLRWGGGSLELEDARPAVPGLRCRPGIASWKVIDGEMKEWSGVAEVESTILEKRRARLQHRRQVVEAGEAGGSRPDESVRATVASAGGSGLPEKWLMRLGRTVFPPTPEEAASMGLERCLRLLPHDANTGGFFVCLIRKTGPTPPSAYSLSASTPFASTDGFAPSDEAMAADEAWLRERGAGGLDREEIQRMHKEQRKRAREAAKEEGGAGAPGGAAKVTREGGASDAAGARAAADEDEDDDDDGAATPSGTTTPGSSSAAPPPSADVVDPDAPVWVGMRQHPTLPPLQDPKRLMVTYQRCPPVVSDAFASLMGLPDSFLRDRIFVRNGSATTLYYHSESAANGILSPVDHAVTAQTLLGQRVRTRVKIVSAGVKIAEARSSFKPQHVAITDTASVLRLGFRPAQAGLHLIATVATRRAVDVTPAELVILLEAASAGAAVSFASLGASLTERVNDTLAAAAEADKALTGGAADDIGNGAVVFRLGDAMLREAAAAEGAPPATASLADASARTHFASRTAVVAWSARGGVLLQVKKGPLLALRQTMAERGLGPDVDLARASVPRTD